MSKKLLLFLFLVLFTLPCKANLESLYQKLSSAEGVSRVEILLDIAKIERPKKSMALTKEAEELSREIGYTNGVIGSWKMFAAIKDDLGAFEQAEFYGKKVIEGYRELGNLVEEIDAYYSLGNIYAASGQYQKNLETIYAGLTLATQHDEKDMIAYGELQLAAFFSYSLENFEKAEKLGLKSYEYFQTTADPENLSHVTHILGYNYMQKGDFDLAQNLLEESLRLSIELMDLSEIKLSNGVLADLFLEKEEYEKAIPYLEEAMRLSIAAEDPLEIAINKLGFAEVAFFQKKEEEGLALAKESLAMAQSLGLMEIEEMVYDLLYTYYDNIGDVETAIFYASKLEGARDSLNVLGVVGQLVDLEIQKVIKEEEAKLLKVEKKNTWQKYIYFGILGFMLIGLVFYRRRNIQKQQQNQAKIDKIAKQKEQQLQEVEKLRAEKIKDLQTQNQLEEKLTLQNQALTSNSILLSKKEELLTNVQESLKEIREKAASPVKNKLISISNLLERHKSGSDNWEKFSIYFQEVHPAFNQKLLQHTSSLNNNDLRFAAYLKLNLSTTEIAEIMGVAPSSIHKARYRFKKKLGLTKSDDLHHFLAKL